MKNSILLIGLCALLTTAFDTKAQTAADSTTVSQAPLNDSLTAKIEAKKEKTPKDKPSDLEKKLAKLDKKYLRKREKAEQAYDYGQYSTAYGKFRLITKKLAKVDTTLSIYISSVALQSKYREGEGKYEVAEKLLNKSYGLFMAHAKPENPNYLLALADVAAAANAYLRPVMAYQAVQKGYADLYKGSSIQAEVFNDEDLAVWLDTSKANVLSKKDLKAQEKALSAQQKNETDSVKNARILATQQYEHLLQSPDSILYHEFDMLLIETQKLRGNYADALARLKIALPKAQILAKKKLYTYSDKKQAYVAQKQKKDELKRRERQLAELYVAEAEILQLSGDYYSALSAQERNEKVLPKYLRNDERLFFKNEYLLAKLQGEFGNDKDSRKNLQALYKNMKSSNKVSRNHKMFYEVIVDVGEAYTEQGKNKKFKKTAKKFRDEVRLKYGTKNPYYTDSRLLLNERTLDSNPKRANRRLVKETERADKFLPTTHAYRQKFYDQFYDIYLKRSQYSGAREVLINGNNLDAVNFGIDAPFYHKGLLRRAAFETIYTNDFATADSLYNTSFNLFVKQQLHPFHKDYLFLMEQYAELNFELDRFDEALKILDECRLIAIKKFGDKSTEYGSILEKIAKVQLKRSEFVLAQNLLEKAERIIRADEGKKNLPYAKLLRTLGELYALNGELEKAKDAIERSQKIMQKLGEKAGPSVTSTDDLIQLYINQGNYATAEDLTKTTIELREGKFGKVHYQLILPYNYLGQIELLKGDFVKAEEAVKTSISITEQTVTDTSSKYNENMVLLSDIYREMGDLDQAKIIYARIIKNNKKIFGANSVKVAESYIGMANVIELMRQPGQIVYPYLDSANVIVEKSLGSNHPMAAEILQARAKTEVREKEFDKAETHLRAAGIIFEEKYGSNHITVADNKLLLADLLYAKADFAKSVEAYDEALSAYRKIFSKTHPLYVKTQSKKAYAYYAMGSYKQAAETIDNSLTQYLGYLKDFFPALSDAEKNKYWASIQGDFEFYNSLAIKYASADPAILGKMYNNRIATKAILLSSSIKVRERIMNSNDEELISKYLLWQEKKEVLTKALSMSESELSENKINVEQLQKELNEVEKYLSLKSEAFAENFESRQFTWQDVAKSLKDDEVAIEIVRFNYFSTQFTDSAVYAVLMLTNKSKSGPELILMNDGNKLETKYYSYYRNVIKYKAKDKNSYEQYWKAVDAKLPSTAKHIYLSPDGVYNQLNIETLQRENGQYLIDDFVFYIVSNTKELPMQQYIEKEEYASSVALLMGNPAFSNHQASGNLRNKNAVSSLEALPGAEAEINTVNGILSSNAWQTETYLLADASENIIKTAQSPRVIHVATHGFFMDTEVGATATATTNPLLKSGLLFTGAGELLSENNANSFNKADGVLTAFEAMNMNLDHTELVVLSACETGLGEIRSGEGVYGLQRSFLVAGAQNVIMTLFKVNDEVTQELMSAFYTEWASTGNKRLAFINAKKAIKEKYEAPLFWGSFVMIGLD